MAEYCGNEAVAAAVLIPDQLAWPKNSKVQECKLPPSAGEK